MSLPTRKERLAADQRALEMLRSTSTILDFRAAGSPPDRYVLIFRGKGLYRDVASGEIREVDRHECDLLLPLAYPDRPPDLRWQTPLFHPNVSFGGFIRIEDIGIPWTAETGLDVVCERLWDVARLAYYNLPEATNLAARRWLESQRPRALPVDRRPLGDDLRPTRENVIRYARRDGRARVLPPEVQDKDLLVIDESTPDPLAWPRYVPARGGEGIWFLDDDARR